MDVAVLARALELTEARCAYVLATVVWRRGPSSGRQGSKALVLADGSVRGWLGGACAEPSVVRCALECLSSGEPALLFLGQPHELDGRAHDGVRSIAMACESEGALEVYLEPHQPEPQVIAVGRSPAVDALAEMALALGWRAVVIDDGGDPAGHARPGLVRDKLDFGGLVVDGATAVVVATQGHYDDLALAAALRAGDAGYVGLVASARRAKAVIEHLRGRPGGEQGGPSCGRQDGCQGGRAASEAERWEAALDRVQAPAGLDLGPVANPEIAVAVMADLVARRARGELTPGADGAAPRRPEAVDPVCGMTVLPADAKYHTVHEGADYWFCAGGCLRAFTESPEAFLTASATT